MFQPCKIGGLLDFAGPSTEVPVPSRAPSRFFPSLVPKTQQISTEPADRRATALRSAEATTWRWNAARRTEVEVVVVADGQRYSPRMKQYLYPLVIADIAIENDHL